MSLINLEQILPLMFQVVISNAGHLNETYHLTLGLLGQLILRLKPAEVDAAVAKVLSTKHSLFAAGDPSTVPEGWKTTHLLFSLGAVCLDRCFFNWNLLVALWWLALINIVLVVAILFFTVVKFYRKSTKTNRHVKDTISRGSSERKELLKD